MSEVRTCFISTLLGENRELIKDPPIGAMVRDMLSDSLGVVVEKINAKEVNVLWAEYKDPWKGLLSDRKITFLAPVADYVKMEFSFKVPGEEEK